ncbi:MAG: tRNA 2-thiouridine(34) synthase MnmA [bacterium]
MPKRVLVAMSGGVDSSVAAALLKDQGYDLIGATMNVWSAFAPTVVGASADKPSRSCCGITAATDAKKVADKLGIPHYTLNFKDVFQKCVIDDFITEYKQGRTPNPCIRCNQFIKFKHLAQKARELGCDYVATGHYVRRLQVTGYRLLKGIDKKKDQSYVLYMMSQGDLAHTLFPLGDMTKDEVRKLAKKYGLTTHDKPESQEICFVEDDDYVRFLKENDPESVKPGNIIDNQGNVVGQHQGIAFYTLGQRKGIGAHKSQPKYVIRLDRENNQVVIGDDGDTYQRELIADELSFIDGEMERWKDGEGIRIAAKIRYNSKEEAATLYPDGKVVFDQPQRSITPGQSVVFYSGEEVLGGGIIA